MSFASRRVKATTAAATLVWLAATVWVLGGYVWPTLSNVEVAALQAMLHPGLFRHDFAVRASLGFTPRFYWDQLILGPARLGLPLAASFALGQLAALAALFGALRALGRALALGAAATAVLGVWMLFVSVGTIGGVYFYTHAPVPAVWAGAVAAWGAVFAVRDRPVRAFACFGAAALLQFLVGFYAGGLALALLWRAGRRPPRRAVLAWGAGLALVYLPMRLGGGTGSPAIDGATFVTIYADLRLPHHLVPTTWPWPFWVQLGLFYAGAWVFVRRTQGAGGGAARLLGATIALVAAALALNYAFVEVVPSAFVAKLQPARITPLAQLVALVLLARGVDDAVRRRAWIEALALAAIPLSLLPGLLLILAALLLRPAAAATERSRRWGVALLALAVGLGFSPLQGSAPLRLAHYAPWAALFLVQLVPDWLARRPRLLWAGAGAAVVGAAACAYASTRPAWPVFLLDRFAVAARPHDPPARLGARFRTYAPRDAIVLVPPVGDTWTFKLYARRADVVDAKNAPFTDRGLLEWRRRLQAVLGAPLTPGLDRVAAWRARSAAALAAVARHYHAQYVLTRDRWHPVMPGRRVDADDGWSVWRLPPAGASPR